MQLEHITHENLFPDNEPRLAEMPCSKCILLHPNSSEEFKAAVQEFCDALNRFHTKFFETSKEIANAKNQAFNAEKTKQSTYFISGLFRICLSRICDELSTPSKEDKLNGLKRLEQLAVFSEDINSLYPGFLDIFFKFQDIYIQEVKRLMPEIENPEQYKSSTFLK